MSLTKLSTKWPPFWPLPHVGASAAAGPCTPWDRDVPSCSGWPGLRSGHLCLRNTACGAHPNSLTLRPGSTTVTGSGMLISAWLWPGQGQSALCTSVFYMVRGTQKKLVSPAEDRMVLILNFTNYLFSAAFLDHLLAGRELL